MTLGPVAESYFDAALNAKRRFSRGSVLVAICAIVACFVSTTDLRLVWGSDSDSEDSSEAVGPESIVGVWIIDVEVGIVNAYKTGYWTPVRLTFDAPAPDGTEAVVAVPDGDDIPVIYRKACGGETETIVYGRFGNPRGELLVRLESEGRILFEASLSTKLNVVAQSNQESVDGETPLKDSSATTVPNSYPEAVPFSRDLIVVVGDGVDAVDDAVRTLRGPTDERPLVVEVESWDQLPDEEHGYDAVDTILFGARDWEAFAAIESNDPRLEAIDQWVSLGGRMLFCVGAEAESFLATDSPFARFAPGRLEEMTTVRNGAALEIYADGDSPLLLDGSPEYPWLSMPVLEVEDGVVESSSGSASIIVRSAYGFGTITFFAADPDISPISEWENRGELFSSLLNWKATFASDESESSTRLMHWGYDDLSGQLRGSLDQYPGVWNAPFFLVLGLVVLYLAVIGPLDYLLVHKVLKRPILTWIVVPTAMLLFVLIAVVLLNTMKSGDVQVRQIDIVDVDTIEDRARGTLWASVYSPRVADYDVNIESSWVENEGAIQAGWFGLPGEGLGGMNATTLRSPDWDSTYEIPSNSTNGAGASDQNAPDACMLGVPIVGGGSKLFTARWSSASPITFESDLEDVGGVVTGSLMNVSGVHLKNCFLVHDQWVYRIENMERGAMIQLGSNVNRSKVSTLLTGIKLVQVEKEEQMRQEATPYDDESQDPAYVLQAIMFYHAAGGAYYTNLSNEYQSFVDMSGLLTTGRAVLVGTADVEKNDAPHAARFVVKDQITGVESEAVERTTIYRFALPVSNRE